MGVTFSSEAVARIRAGIKKIEAQPTDHTATRTPPGPSEQRFFAFLTGCDLSGKRYSWMRVFPDMSSDSPDLILDSGLKWKVFGETPVTGYETALEGNGVRGLTDIVVELQFAGFNADGDVNYIFMHQQVQDQFQIVPLHDHRDNLTGGGFAFACYHPGTGLPQQPWHV